MMNDVGAHRRRGIYTVTRVKVNTLYSRVLMILYCIYNNMTLLLLMYR